MSRAHTYFHQPSYYPDPPGREEREGRKKEVGIADLLLWAYRDQKVDKAVVGGHNVGSSWDGMGGRLASIGALGTVVSGGGGSYVGEVEAHPDARAVHRIVTALDADQARMVQSQAALGHPGFEHSFALPRFQRRGARVDGHVDFEARFSYDPAWRGGKEPSLCYLAIVPAIEDVLAHRALYQLWRGGLALLSRQFRARPWLLQRHAVTDALPPVLPAAQAWWSVKPIDVPTPLSRSEAAMRSAQRRFGRSQDRRLKIALAAGQNS